MQTLWRKTSELFWQYPILWLPILIADILQFLLLQFQRLVNQRIVAFVAEGPRSVLGGPPDPPANPYLATMKAGLLAAPLSAGIYLLCVCLYVAGLLITARLVQTCLEGDNLKLKATTSEVVRTSKARILVLSIKILSLFIFGFLLFTQIDSGFSQFTTVSGRNVGYAFAIILTAITGYILTPAVMRVLQPSQPVSAADLGRARWAVILTTIASSVIGLSAAKAELSFFTGQPYPSALTRQTMELVGTLFAALPYVPLAIALSLIAFDPNMHPEEIGITE